MKNKAGTMITTNISWHDITPGGMVYGGGTAASFKTGDWRTMKPVFKADACTQCLLCAPVCPDSAIPVTDSKRLEFDYDHCKGCGICFKVCPFGAIDFVKEEK
ncbi:MAG: pyruvate ferredoxin oxidoreductase delta subunit [Clostridiales bacterium]|jgi:pyruvate ferredoxin oxidoreductase delta subunit|nr:pyruvate ferredoxin oxidoreductase delta subunit [Clostridiales bacterium]MDN5298796.1 pyruvate ferredoxin oxidoreductase delta subunit [Clostridiales bacterium]